MFDKRATHFEASFEDCDWVEKEADGCPSYSASKEVASTG